MEALDKIEKQTILRAPISRIWRAIANANEFGDWFGVLLDGPFEEGKTITGTFLNLDEATLSDHQKELDLEPSAINTPGPHTVFCTVERIEPESYFSFRWIPYGIDADVDPQSEPTTLVEFRLKEVPEGTHLTITESGFNEVPEHRRKRAFLMNDDGWTQQLEHIKKHVER